MTAKNTVNSWLSRVTTFTSKLASKYSTVWIQGVETAHSLTDKQA